MSFKFVKELIIKTDDLVSAALRLLPGGNLGKETVIRTTQTDNRIIDTPDASGIISLRDNTEELENKTIDADKNPISNLSVSEFASGVIATNLGTPNNTSIPTTLAVSASIDPIQDEIDLIKEHHNLFTAFVVLDAGNISSKSVTIPAVSWMISYVKIADGPVISESIDATITSIPTQVIISWDGFWLDGVLAEGDTILVGYYQEL